MAERVVRVRLSATTEDYVSKMREAATATRSVESAGASSAPALTSAFSKIKAGASEMVREIKKASSTDEWKRAATSLTVVGGAVTAIGVAALKTGVQYNQLQQSTRAALTTLLGSARAANEQMDKLDAFARTSPFSKQTFIRAQQQMLAFGIETKKVIPYLDAVQNSVAAAGGSSQQVGEIAYIMSQISAASKITATDLMQFGQRGINAADLIGSAMGKTGTQIREEITAGTLGADEALDALAQGMSTKFGGAADNVKNTFGGAMDRVSAAWRDFSAELARPLVDPNGGGMLVDLLNWSADALRNFEKLPGPVKNTASAVAGIGGAGTLAVGSMMLLVPKVLEAREAFSKLAEQMPRTSSALGSVGKWAGIVAALTATVVIGTDALVSWQREMRGTEETGRRAATTHQTLTDTMDKLGITARATAEGVKQALDALSADWSLSDGLANAPLLGDAGDRVQELRDALVELKPALEGLPLDQQVAKFQQWAGELDLTQEQARKLLDEMPWLDDAIASYLASTGAAADAQSVLNYALGEGESATADNEAALAALTGQAEDAEGAIEDLSDAISSFGSVALDAREAERKFEKAIDDATDALEKNGATLDVNTDAGRDNEKALDDIAKAANDTAAAILKHTGSEDDATAALNRGRDALVTKAQKFGMTKAAAEAYADEVVADMDAVKRAVQGVPDSKSVKVTVSGGAADAIARIQNRLGLLPSSKTITVTAQRGGNGWGVLANSTAAGNFAGNLYKYGKVQAFASGGYPSEIVRGRPGGYAHVYGEGEMGVPWETYISGRAADRDRNVGIWQETGKLLGVTGAGGGDLGPLIAEVRALRDVLHRPNLTIHNPVSKSAARDAYEAQQMLGG